MAEEMMNTGIRFKLLDRAASKVIRDSSFFMAIVGRDNGVGTVFVSRKDVKVLLGTGFVAKDGGEIFADDIVRAVCDGENTTDKVWWNGEGWQFGAYLTPMNEIQFLKIEGNANEMAWPIDIDTPDGAQEDGAAV